MRRQAVRGAGCGRGLVLAAALAAALAPAPRASAVPDPSSYPVSRFELLYGRPHPDLPPLEELAVAVPKPAEGRGPTRYSAGALRAVSQQLVAELNRRGFQGVMAAPHPEDIDPRDGRDLRGERRDALRLVIWVGRVSRLGTTGYGERVPDESRDHPLHRRLAQASPVQPGDPLRGPELAAWVARLNRHPGRRVDTRVGPGPEPGDLSLELRVAEWRPLRAFVQGSNTGTKSTTEWRQRFGLSHTQLTGRDDVLRFDYVTGGFDQLNAVFGSYAAPVPGVERLRAGLRGAWSEYDASELGIVLARFTGEQWDVGGDLEWLLWQRGDLFLDLFAGARWQRVEVRDRPDPGMPAARGDADFFLPELGVRVERVRADGAMRASLSGMLNAAAVAGTRGRDVASLGRPAVDDPEFGIFYWSASASQYLEPWLAAAGFADRSTLAHELAVDTRGQYLFGTRLAPQFQGVVGGLHTVRGYDQSIAAGDTVVAGRAEYRFHLPRVLGVRADPPRLPCIGPFRIAPDRARGWPDWDLILRAFVDVAHTRFAGSVPGERSETLVGVGPGVELRILRHLVLRFDFGVALTPVADGLLAEAGSHAFHFSGTLAY